MPVPSQFGTQIHLVWLITPANIARELEENLCCVLRRPLQNLSDLTARTARATVQPIFYRSLPNPPCIGDTAEHLRALIYDYNMEQDPTVCWLRSSGQTEVASTAVLKRDTTCLRYLRKLSQGFQELDYQLGSDSAAWFLSRSVERLDDIQSKNMLFEQHDASLAEKSYLLYLLRSVQVSSRSDTQRPRRSAKLLELLELLTRLKGNRALTGLIFVRQRATAIALTHTIATESSLQPFFKVGSFVGTSSARSSARGDLLEIEEQQDTLKHFRLGAKNLLVATDVLEEGLDIPACNFVICLDPPAHLTSFVQCRGRARQQGSVLYIFYNDQRQVKDWEAAESCVNALLASDRQFEDQEIQREAVEESDDRSLHISTTGQAHPLPQSIFISLANVVQCNVVPRELHQPSRSFLCKI